MKNLIKILFLLAIAAIVNFACQKEIEIEANPLDEQIVVEGTIENGKEPEIILTKTGFYYDEINAKTIEGLYLHNAVITISGAGQQVELEEVCDYGADAFFESSKQLLSDSLGIPVAVLEALYNSFTPAQKDSLVQSIYPDAPLTCKYLVPSGSTFIGHEGETYSLDIVTADNKTVSSKTTIPIQFGIDSLTYAYNEDHPQYARVDVNLNFPVGQALGKYVKFGSKKQNEDYFFGGIGGSVYSDAAFAGSTILKLPLLYNERGDTEDIPFAVRGSFMKGDTASLIWINIDKETYDFLYSVENDGGASPFSSPTTPQSNIVGGIGIWAGYNTSEYSVYIP